VTKLSIKITDNEVAKTLSELGGFVPESLEEIGPSIVDLIQLGFDASEDPYGNTWDAVIRGGKPLRDTSTLMNSFNAQVAGDSVAIGSNLTVGDGHNLASIHQDGATIRAKAGGLLRFMIGDRFVTVEQVKIPARPIIPEEENWPDTWREEVNEIILNHILK